MKRTPAYNSWLQMRYRCHAIDGPAAHNYVKRGITCSDAWESFAQFLADMGEPPPGYTLERIDNNLGYSKENCRWATRMDQAQNTRHVRKFTYQNTTGTLRQLAQIYGWDFKLIHTRLKKGWSLDDAVKLPRTK